MLLTLVVLMSQCKAIAEDKQQEYWPKLYFRKGETAYLPCIPQGDANAYFWKKGDTFGSSEDVASILHGIPDDSSNGKKGKYVIFENGTLAISSVTSEDEGRYFCRIVSESNECYASLTVDLIVELEASFLTIEECSPRPSCTLFASLHSKLNLTCTAYSVPPLTTLRWFNGTKEISSGVPVTKEENKDLSFKLSQVIQVTYGIPSSLSCKATDIQNHEKTVHVQLETLEVSQCQSPVVAVAISVVLVIICIVAVAISVSKALMLRKEKQDLEKGQKDFKVPLQNKEQQKRIDELQNEKSELKKEIIQMKEVNQNLQSEHSSLKKKYEDQEQERLEIAEIKGQHGKLQDLNRELQSKYEELKSKHEKMEEVYRESLSALLKLKRTLETSQRKYRSLEMKQLDKVSLSCRISPRATTSKELIEGDRTLQYGTTSYQFGQLHSKETSQEAIFKSLESLIQNAIDGENVFVFAVGGSSTGKTFTMYGEAGGSKRNQGLVPRALDRIFKQKEKLEKIGFKVNIKARYIHVCRGTGKGKEKYSLTSPTKPNLKCTEETYSFENDTKLSIKIFQISSIKDALTLLEGETSLRQMKGKSDQENVEKLHGIFQVTVETMEKSATFSTGNLSLVIVRGFEALRESFKKPDKYSTNLSHYLAPFVQGDKCRGVLIAHITPDKFQESKTHLDELNKIKAEAMQ